MIDLAELTYQRPDLDQVENQLRRARLHLRLAMSASSALSAVRDMEQVTRQYRLAEALAKVGCLRGGSPGMEPDQELDFFTSPRAVPAPLAEVSPRWPVRASGAS